MTVSSVTTTLILLSLLACCLATNIVKPNLATGCDMTLGSGLTVDKCGVCGGSGKSCRFRNGLFRRQTLSNDFHVVATIPAGAIRINITEMHASGSYLALRSANLDGPFFINGRLKQGVPDPANSYHVAGTVFEYKRPRLTNKGESMLAKGPTTEDLTVLLFYQGNNPGIYHEYSIPNPGTSLGGHKHHQQRMDDARHGLLDRRLDINPILGSSDSHDDIDGSYRLSHPQKSPSRLGPNFDGGLYSNQNRFNNFNSPNFRPPPPGFPQSNSNIPRINNNEDRTNEAMNRMYNPYWPHVKSPPRPSANARDPDEESSNIRREAIQVNIQLPEVVGETAWRTQGFGPCTKTCAEGVRITIVRCVAIATNEKVDERHCSGPRPKVRRRKCNRHSCPAHYSVGRWSECSRTCGNGRRTRRVVCRQHFAGNFTAVVSHKKCRGLPKPPSHEKCIAQECAHWEVDREWSRCDAKCGTGTQMRRAVCKGGNGETLPDFQCSAARRPSNIRPCDAGACVTGWYVTDWEECSADCDRGVQRRNVYCLNTARAIAGCPSRTEPNTTRTCARNSCNVKHEWFAGAWGTCSSKCGKGIQERTVTCLSVEPDGTISVPAHTNKKTPCRLEDKPATQQSCNTQSCGSRWHYTPWSECSVSCGGGSRTRDIQCLDANGAYSSLCNIKERPKEAERCNTVNCLALRDPNCEDSLAHCQIVLQARLCTYDYYKTMCCFTCSSPRLNVRSARRP